MEKITSLTASQWAEVERRRDEWLAWGLSTAPADRATAEATITEMYRLIGKDRPQFLWVDSPATANLAIWLFDGKLDDASLLTSLAASLAASLRTSLDTSLGASLRTSLDTSLGASLRTSLGASLGASLGTSLGASLGTSLDTSLLTSLRTSLLTSLDASLRTSLLTSLRTSLRTSLLTSLDASLLTSLDTSLDASLLTSLRASLRTSLGASRLHLNYDYFLGQMHYWWAYYQIPEQLGIVTYAAEGSRRLELWASITRSCGWWWPFEDLCIISERPREIHTEPWTGAQAGAVRLHREDGPALLFPDGWGLHAWHGTRVPAWVIEHPTVEAIAAERNAEIRRCGIESMGWPRFTQAAGLSPVDTCPDPGNPGQQLALYDVPEHLWGAPVRVLVCVNGTVERDGTRRTFGLTVPADLPPEDGYPQALTAAAWGYRLTAAQYAQAQVRR